MKTRLCIILLVLLSTAISFSCKKDSTAAGKDYAASVKDKTWWGMLAYTGKPQEPYSVHFNTGNSLNWSQLPGDNPGHWALDGKALTITFDGNNLEIKADISENDELVNIKDNSTASDIISGGLIANSSNSSLDNTTWSGTIDYPSTKALQLSFKPGMQVIVNVENIPVKTYTYTRSSSNTVIRISTAFFGIIISSSKMKGCIDNAGYIWQLTKQ